MALRRPGGELAARELHFIWILDTSGSMSGDKIGSLNFAIQDSLPAMRQAADENPTAKLMVRAIQFSSTADWVVKSPTPVNDFHWTDLQASGVTAMGAALKEVASQLDIPPMSDRSLPPVLVLVTDGEPTDNFQNGLAEIMQRPWGRKAVRLGIAIGDGADKSVLEQFIANPELPVLTAGNSETLVKYIRWASTVVVSQVSAPASQTSGAPSNSNVSIPLPATNDSSVGANDVW